MGILNLVFDAVLISSAAAGIRRTTGLSAQQFVNAYIQNPTARAASSGFFRVGEWTVEKGISLARSERFQKALKNAQDSSESGTKKP